MKEYISNNKLVTLILAAAIFLGAFVRIWNLHDGRFLWPDEYRATGNLSGRLQSEVAKSVVLNIVYKIPAFFWGAHHHVALYTSAFWGTLGILTVFLTGKILINDKVGAYSAFILSLLAFHVKFSRNAYASILQSFLILSSFLLFYLYAKNNKTGYSYIVPAGILLALAFGTHPSSYAAIASFAVLAGLIMRYRGLPLKKSFIAAACMLGTVAASLILGELLMRLSVGSYFYHLLQYRREQPLYFQGGNPGFHVFGGLLAAILADGGIFQCLIIISGIIYCAVDCFRKKNRSLILLQLFIGLSYLIFSIMSLLSVHVNLPRHHVYLLPFLSIGAAYSLYSMELITNKYFPVMFLLVFTAFSLPGAVDITASTFRIKPITQWLGQHNIAKDKIISTLNIHEDKDTRKTASVPGKLIAYQSPAGYFKIDWRTVRKFYDEKGIRYILISGIGSLSTAGYNDPVLSKFKPLKTWTHPYRRENPGNKKLRDFAIYALKDIFTPNNSGPG